MIYEMGQRSHTVLRFHSKDSTTYKGNVKTRFLILHWDTKANINTNWANETIPFENWFSKQLCNIGNITKIIL